MEDSRKTAHGEVPCESPVCEQTLPHPEVVACVRAQMPDPEQQQRLADLFRMFGDASRIRILAALQRSEMCVCDLAQLLGLTVYSRGTFSTQQGAHRQPYPCRYDHR